MTDLVPYELLWPTAGDNPGIDNIWKDERIPFKTPGPLKRFQIEIKHQDCVLNRFDFKNCGSPRVEVEFDYQTEEEKHPNKVFRKVHKAADNSNVFEGSKMEEVKKITLTEHKVTNRIKIILSSDEEKVLGLYYFKIYSADVSDRRNRKELLLEKDPQLPRVKPERNARKEGKPREPVLNNMGAKHTNSSNQRLSKVGVLQEEECVEIPSFGPKKGPIKYHLIWNNECQHNLDGVTDEWLDQNQKAEIQAGVPPEHRLRRRVRAKPFDKKKETVFVMVSNDLYKFSMSVQAIKLGLKIVHIIEDGTLVVTDQAYIEPKDRSDCQGVQYVNSDYIRDCIIDWKRLDTKSYLVSTEPPKQQVGKP